MVALSDIYQVAGLNNELSQINRSLEAINAGDVIVSVQFGREGTEDRPVITTASVATYGMPYPAQMIDAIRGFLSTRAQAIREQLAALGVTQ